MEKAGKSKVEFTGEFFVPGESGQRIEDDHRERYRFACGFAEGREVIDIACGFGYGGPMLLSAGAKEYLGVDINKDLVEQAGRKYGTDKVRYEQGDVCTYEPAHPFDLVLCFETIEHVRDYRAALVNMGRMLRGGGLLIISSPNRPVTSPKAKRLSDKPRNEFHTQEFTVGELEHELRSAGFAVDDGAVYGQRLSPPYTRNRVIARVVRLVLGDPRERSSPEVRAVGSGIPRYFVIVAGKSDARAGHA